MSPVRHTHTHSALRGGRGKAVRQAGPPEKGRVKCVQDLRVLCAFAPVRLGCTPCVLLSGTEQGQQQSVCCGNSVCCYQLR